MAHSGTLIARSKAAEEKFVKLREVYQKLRTEHITLLRTDGEVQKKLQTAEKTAQEMEADQKVRNSPPSIFHLSPPFLPLPSSPLPPSSLPPLFPLPLLPLKVTPLPQELGEKVNTLSLELEEVKAHMVRMYYLACGADNRTFTFPSPHSISVGLHCSSSPPSSLHALSGQ